jgi:hypothetical protein
VGQVPDRLGVEAAMHLVGGPATVRAEADIGRGGDREADGVGGGAAPLVNDLEAVEAELAVPVAQAGRFTHREAPLPGFTCWTSSLPGFPYPIASSLPLPAILAENQIATAFFAKEAL